MVGYNPGAVSLSLSILPINCLLGSFRPVCLTLVPSLDGQAFTKSLLPAGPTLIAGNANVSTEYKG